MISRLSRLVSFSWCFTGLHVLVHARSFWVKRRKRTPKRDTKTNMSDRIADHSSLAILLVTAFSPALCCRGLVVEDVQILVDLLQNLGWRCQAGRCPSGRWWLGGCASDDSAMFLQQCRSSNLATLCIGNQEHLT